MTLVTPPGRSLHLVALRLRLKSGFQSHKVFAPYRYARLRTPTSSSVGCAQPGPADHIAETCIRLIHEPYSNACFALLEHLCLLTCDPMVGFLLEGSAPKGIDCFRG